MPTLQPCPACGHGPRYRYAGVTLREMLGTVLGAAGHGLAARAVTGGTNPAFGMAKAFYHVVFRNVKETPLLSCTACNGLSVVCLTCDTMLQMSPRPRAGELFECASCTSEFMVCERSPEMDALVVRA